MWGLSYIICLYTLNSKIYSWVPAKWPNSQTPKMAFASVPPGKGWDGGYDEGGKLATPKQAVLSYPGCKIFGSMMIGRSSGVCVCARFFFSKFGYVWVFSGYLRVYLWIRHHTFVKELHSATPSTWTTWGGGEKNTKLMTTIAKIKIMTVMKNISREVKKTHLNILHIYTYTYTYRPPSAPPNV